MLVKLTSSTSGKMVMFSEHAHELFGWIGKECVAHGVFTTEQLPEAIARLRQGMEEEKLAVKSAEVKKAANHSDDDEDDDEHKKEKAAENVSLAQRALPLIHLMEWTQKEGGFIVWEASADF